MSLLTSFTRSRLCITFLLRNFSEAIKSGFLCDADFISFLKVTPHARLIRRVSLNCLSTLVIKFKRIVFARLLFLFVTHVGLLGSIFSVTDVHADLPVKTLDAMSRLCATDVEGVIGLTRQLGVDCKDFELWRQLMLMHKKADADKLLVTRQNYPAEQ